MRVGVCHFCERPTDAHAPGCPHYFGDVYAYDIERSKASARRLLAQCGLTREDVILAMQPRIAKPAA